MGTVTWGWIREGDREGHLGHRDFRGLEARGLIAAWSHYQKGVNQALRRPPRPLTHLHVFMMELPACCHQAAGDWDTGTAGRRTQKRSKAE